MTDVILYYYMSQPADHEGMTSTNNRLLDYIRASCVKAISI